MVGSRQSPADAGEAFPCGEEIREPVVCAFAIRTAAQALVLARQQGDVAILLETAAVQRLSALGAPERPPKARDRPKAEGAHRADGGHAG